jgi:hypothetical protein
MFRRSSSKPKISQDEALAHSLAKLWPHREHESNAVKNLCCLFGLHSWRQLNLEELALNKEVRYCFWCSRIKIDGVIYDGWQSS